MKLAGMLQAQAQSDRDDTVTDRTLKAILKKLENLSLAIGDPNAIRNGEYDRPRGAGDWKHPKGRNVTFEDLYAKLEEIQVEAQQQTVILGDVADALANDNDD